MARRQRRAIWAVALFVAGSLLGGGVGLAIHRARQPKPYRPGEFDPEITRTLDRPAKTAAALPPSPVIPDAARPVRDLPAGAPVPRFTDVTAQAGLAAFRTFAGQRTSQLPEDMGGGAAWGDFDNDGYDDLFLVSNGGPLNAPPEQLAPSLLYRNLGNGTFRPVDDFPDTRIIGMGAAWGDYNNDGWLDLVVTGYNTLRLFRNEHGRLVRDTRFPEPKGFWTSAAWGDFDNDGYLDLYVCGYVRYIPDTGHAARASKQFGLDVPFTLNPSSYEPERNLLFHNNRNGTFTEVARKLGVADPTGRSLGALWHDFDNDGWLDLYVANDVSANKLYLNRHGKFVDASQSAWIGEYRGSMGLAAGDFDRDGDDDLFISHWIAQQYALYQSLLTEQKTARTSNARELHFMDVAEMKGVGQPSLQSIGWGAAFADFDGDGWLDLAVANGSTFETGPSPRQLVAMPSFLFWNQQGKFFHNLAPWAPALAAPHASRGLAVADYDNDGAMDLLIVDHDAGVRLLHNGIERGNWLELRLRNRQGRGGDGSTVVAHVGGVDLRRTVTGASYLSQDSRRLHFGLGDQTSVANLDVHWLGGKTETYSGLDANAIWELTEGDPVARRVGAAPPALVTGQGRVLDFWAKQRAAMDAMKKDGDAPRAIRLFREALALNPNHEDSRYYLANCLAMEGDTRGALAQLDELLRINPQSRRAWQRRGVLLASTAASRAQLSAAEESLRKALAINPEETGTLLILGEVALARGDAGTAAGRFEAVSRANPRSVGSLFLRAYLAWKRGDAAQARRLLQAAHAARGRDWKPPGSVAEGDVRRRMHAEGTYLSQFWEHWDGSPDPAKAFAPLAAFLPGVRHGG
jgi:tetratricopeptide (TPR) repeat protein